MIFKSCKEKKTVDSTIYIGTLSCFFVTLIEFSYISDKPVIFVPETIWRLALSICEKAIKDWRRIKHVATCFNE